jgi:hypothetical protein
MIGHEASQRAAAGTESPEAAPGRVERVAGLMACLMGL